MRKQGNLHEIAGLSFALLAHLATIPVIALYGVHICPVLGRLGFVFGCKYNAAFVLFVTIANVCLNVTAWIIASASSRTRFAPVSFACHLVSFAMGILLLNSYLREIHVPDNTFVRMNVAFAITALLLSVLQAQIVDWIIQVRVRASKPLPTELEQTRRGGFLLRWTMATIWHMLPYVAVLGVLGIFVMSKLYTMIMMGADIGLDEIYGLSLETGKVGIWLLGWLASVRVFQYLKDRALIESIRTHLDAISELKTEYYSSTLSAGFWQDLFIALNNTTRIVAQRARLIDGFSSYVAGDVVEKILRSDELKPEGETRSLTILVSDLRDFTRMSNSMKPEDVVQVLNTYFADMIDVLTRHDMVLDKFIGDGILAYVSPSITDEKRRNRLGVEAALAMHARLAETNARLSARGLPTLKLGVAVHSGEVVLGSIGAPRRMQHTVIGDSVNTAARLESLCKEHGVGVIVSEAVRNSLPQELGGELRDLGEQEIRGLARPLRIFGTLGGKAGLQRVA